MKRKAFAKASLAAAVVAALSSVAGAASQTWTGTADTSWATPGNWSGNAVPGINPAANADNTTDVATFNSNPTSGTTDPLLIDANRMIGRIVFDTASAGAFTLGTVGGSTLMLGNNLTVIDVRSDVVKAQTINVAVALHLPSSTNGAATIQNNATGATATLTLAGGIVNSPNSTRGTAWTLGGTNTGENTVSGAINISSTGGTASSLTKTGTGTWVLAGANVIPGGVTINDGILAAANNAALGTSGTVTINGGILEIRSGITLDNGLAALNLNNGATIRAIGTAGTNAKVNVGNAAGTSVTLATAGTTDVFTIGNAANEFTGGAADSVVHLAGGGTFAFSGGNYAGGVVFDAGGKLALGGAFSVTSLSGTGTVQNNGATSGTLVASIASGSKTISNTLQNSGGGGTLGLTKNGLGTLSLTGPLNYTGTTAINAGSLNIDLSGTAASTAIGAVTMAGARQQVIGAAAGSTLTSTSTAVSAGYNVISAGPVGGGTNPTINLGTISGVAGSALRIDGAAYNNGASSGTTTGGNTVAATANYTGSGTTTTGGLLSYSASVSNAAGAYATVGLYDWAALSGGSVVGGSQVSGFYSTLNGSLPTGFVGINLDLTASATMAGNTTSTAGAYGTVRFNANAAVTLTGARALAANNVGGILVTPNVGANTVTINNGNNSGTAIHWQATRSANSATGWTVWQNNTAGELVINAQYDNGTNSGATDSYTQAGDGTVRLNGVNGYTGQSYLLGGTTIITAYSGLGGGAAPATLAQVNLNGGTLIGNASAVSTDFSGTVLRNIVLGTNGGALAATTGNTLSSAGVVSGVGALNIGTGSIAGGGLLTGNGTVVLSAANQYSGGTVLNAGTLDFNGAFALGGANYGGTRFNGGTLRWAAAFPGTNGSSDISIATANGNAAVYLDTNGGTMNTNGNNVSFANGVSGVGALTKTGAGTLAINGASTYSGATNVSGGALVVNGSHSGAGAYLVGTGATLSGGGSITTAGNAGVTVGNGGKLAPGGATPGAMTLNLGTGSLDVSGAVTAVASQSLLFRIGPTAASDKLAVTGGVNIGNGVLEFDDLALIDTGNIQVATYTLIDSNAAIVGSLGSNLSGTFYGHIEASLALSQDGTDLLLNVTSAPEPSSLGLLAVGGLGLLRRRRRAK